MQEVGSAATVATGQSRRRGRPLARVELQPEQLAELQRRIRAATSSQRDALRARIIRACAGGSKTGEVARRCGVHPRTVERWRSRFLRLGLEGLNDRPRAGHKPKFDSVTRLQIIALACEPMKSKNGVSRRTIEQLRQTAISGGIVEDIGWSSVQRILAQGEIRPHMVRNWLHSPDPQFREKVTEITELYLNPPPGEVVLSVDEKTSMQALERRFADQPPAPRRARRREFEYKRHGTQSLFCAFDVHTGRVVDSCNDRRTAQDLVLFMEKLATHYPQGKVHIIWDNLNIHFDGPENRWCEFNRRHGYRFIFHYTPKHASWVNQVELFFSILERQCLRHASFCSTDELRAAVLEFIAFWNRENAHPFRWTFTGYPLQSGVKLKKAS